MVYPLAERPTYRHYFEFANASLSGEKIIVANSDIFFDDTLNLLEAISLEGRVLALTRYNLKPYLNHTGRPWVRNEGSQDSWIFQAPIRNFYSDIKLGWYGCDNWIAWEMDQAGLEVLNPSLTIHTWHVHEFPRKHKSGVAIGAGNYHPEIRLPDGTFTKRKLLPFIELKDLPPQNK